MSLRRPRWAEHSELCGIRQEIKAKSRLGKPKARILKTSRARPAEIAAKLRATIPSILRIASEHAIFASRAYTLTDPYLGPILQIGSHLNLCPRPSGFVQSMRKHFGQSAKIPECQSRRRTSLARMVDLGCGPPRNIVVQNQE
jgi:hypothetical protein